MHALLAERNHLVTQTQGTPASDALLNLAEFSLRIGDLPRARTCAVQALERALAEGANASVAKSHLIRAECELRESNPAAAETYFTKAFGLALASHDPALERFARIVGARVSLALGFSEDALYLLGETDDPWALATRCLAHLERLEFDEARAAIERAVNPPLELAWRVPAAAAKLYATWGRTDEARAHSRRADEILQELSALFPEGRNDPERRTLLIDTEEGKPWYVLEAMGRINRAVSLDRLLRYLVDVAIAACGASRGILRVLETTVARRADGRSLTEEEARISRHLLETVAQSGTPFLSADATAHPELGKFDSIRALEIRSVYCLPLRSRGQVVGILYLDHSSKTGAFGEKEQRLIHALAEQMALLVENATLAAAALTDALTGLGNSVALEKALREELVRARRYGEKFSLLLLNLDHFKLVNDAHGFEVGNRLLKEMARLLESTVSAGRRPFVSRTAADTFAILLPQTDVGLLKNVASAALKAIRSHPFEGGLTASAGGATWPQDARTVHELFLHADRALRTAKGGGRDRTEGAPPIGEEEDVLLLSRPGRMILSMVGKVIDESDDLDRALQTTLQMMCRAVGASAGTIGLFDDKREVQFRATLGEAPSLGAIQKVLATDRPLRIERCAEDDWARGQQSIRSLNIASLAVVPIRFRGKPAGVVYLDKRGAGAAFREEDLSLLEQFANRVAAVLVRSAEAETKSRRASQLEVVVAAQQQQLQRRSGFGQILGRSPAMQKVYSLLEKVSRLDYAVIIEGETGTGKELAARAIHFESPRKDKPFLPVNCGSLAETVLESELFGHMKGAFTGAHANRTGLFEAADGGTLFLDEIEEMSPGMQTKLLRVLEEKRIRPVGSTKDIPINVRVVAATNVALKDLIKEEKFREDLYYRLATITISLPPLRDRVDDLPLLIEQFLTEISEETKSAPKRLNPDAMKLLAAYPWPGNIRELKNVLRGLVILSEEEIREEHLPESFREKRGTPVVGSYRQQLDSAERDILLRALQDNTGNVRATARTLRMARSTLLRKMDRYKLAGDLE